MKIPPSDPLLSLLGSADPAQVRQGMELASALGDPAWFDAFLRPVQPDRRFTFTGSPLPRWLTLWLILEAPPGSAEAARLCLQISSLHLVMRDLEFSSHANLSRLVNLRTLHLEGPAIDLSALDALPRLERLDLLRCRHWILTTRPARLPALRSLSLIDSRQASLAGLDMPLLEDLQVKFTSLTSVAGARAPRLRELRLDGYSATILSFDAEFPALERLEGHVVTAASGSMARLESLRDLSLTLQSRLPDLPAGLERLALQVERPESVIANLPNLRELSLNGAAWVRAVRLEGLPRLERLSIAGLPAVLGLERLPGLRQLSLRAALSQQDWSILADLPALEELRLKPEEAALLPPLPPRVRVVQEP